MTKDDKKVQPMDPSITENKTPVVKENAPRVCHAIKQLNEEVWVLFPETPVEYSNYTGRNVALDVTYDLSNLDAGDVYDFTALISLLNNSDNRVDFATVDSDTLTALVSMWPNTRTQDLRDSFGLAEAYAVLGESGSDEIFDGGSSSSTSDDVFDGGGA